jgi:NADH-quinone oxidoreductase subunit L
VIDQGLIDGFFVNGFAAVLTRCASSARAIQSGYLFHYVGLMVLGLFGFLGWFILG